MRGEQALCFGTGGKGGFGAFEGAAFGRGGQGDGADVFEARRGRAVVAAGKEGNAVSGAQVGAGDSLNVDGGAFVAIDGDAAVSADVGDVFVCHDLLWVRVCRVYLV